MATAADFYYVRPDEAYAIGGAVSGGTETSYDEDWLVDGRPGRPARAATGSETWTIVGTAAAVGIVAVCNHNIDAAKTITMGGDLSTTLTGPAVPSNGIRLNPWVSFTEVAGVDSVTIDIASNTNAIIIGELVMGKRRTLERSLSPRPSFGQKYQTVDIDSEFDSLMPYDKGVIARTLSGSVVLTDSGLADVQAWVDSTKGGSLPTLIVPLSTVQDAWLVKITEFSYQPSSKNRNEVSLAFQEYPRSRW
jgi:hypothetical protein